VVTEPDDPRAALTREVSRVSARLRSLSPQRLARPDAGGLTPAVRAHRVAQDLADLAARSAGRSRRVVPVIADHGVADQVAVTAADVLAEGDAGALTAALDTLIELRRVL
jgi:hypothetical protein